MRGARLEGVIVMKKNDLSLEEEIRSIIEHTLSELDHPRLDLILDAIMDNIVYIFQRDWKIDSSYLGRPWERKNEKK